MPAVELLVVVALAVVVGVVTLALCDLAGSIARAKGSSYWAFFAFALLLWFPALITALALPDRSGSAPTGRPLHRAETVAAGALLVLAALAVGAGIYAAVSYAP